MRKLCFGLRFDRFFRRIGTIILPIEPTYTDGIILEDGPYLMTSNNEYVKQETGITPQ